MYNQISKVKAATFSMFALFTCILLPNSANGYSLSPSNDIEYKKEIAQFYKLPSVDNLTLLKISGYQQTQDYTCGPSAVMSLLKYYGVLNAQQMNKETEMKIANEMHSNANNGTSPQQMASWLLAHGFNVKSGEYGTLTMLQNNLNHGIPVIIEWIDWGGHWEVVAGYDKEGKSPDDDKDNILFADPSAHFNNVKFINGLTVFNPDRFNSMWFDAQYFNPGHLVKGIYIIATPKKLISNIHI